MSTKNEKVKSSTIGLQLYDFLLNLSDLLDFLNIYTFYEVSYTFFIGFYKI